MSSATGVERPATDNDIRALRRPTGLRDRQLSKLACRTVIHVQTQRIISSSVHGRHPRNHPALEKLIVEQNQVTVGNFLLQDFLNECRYWGVLCNIARLLGNMENLAFRTVRT
jgi:hypothetical protein